MSKKGIMCLIALMLALFAMPSFADDSLVCVAAYDQSALVDHILYEAYERIGYTLSMDVQTMASALASFNSGIFDALACQTDEMSAYIHAVKVDEPIATLNVVALGKAGSGRHLDAWEDLNGLKIGRIVGTEVIASKLPEHIAQLQYADAAALYQALHADEIDAALISFGNVQLGMWPDDIESMGILMREPCYTFVHDKNAHLVPLLEQALKDMKADGTMAKILDGTHARAEQKQVLHISSYAPEDEWDALMSASIKETLCKDGKVDYYNVPLYSTRVSSNYQMTTHVNKTIRSLFVDGEPDVVMVSDNAAFEFVKAYATVLFQNSPVIYAGVTGDDATFKALPARFAGVQEVYSIKDNIDLIMSLFPDTHTIYAINEQSLTGNALRAQIDEQAQALTYNVKIKHNQARSYSAMLADIGQIKAGTVLLVGAYSSDPQDSYRTRRSIQQDIMSRASVPVFSLNNLGAGEIGGKMSDAGVQGREAAKMVLKLINGASTAELKAPDAYRLNQWRFDLNALDKWGISKQALPKDAQYINEAPSLRNTNPQAFYALILAGVMMLIALAGVLVFAILIQRKNTKLVKTQKELVSAERFQAVYDEMSKAKMRLDVAMKASASAVWEMDLETQTMSYDESFREMYRLPEENKMDTVAFYNYVERFIETPKNLYQSMLNLIVENDHFSREITCRFLDGTMAYYITNAKRIYDAQGKTIGLVGLSTDVTARVKNADEARMLAESILDKLEMEIYLSDIETDELLFANSPVKKMFNITCDYTGQKCYEVLVNRTERCEFCAKRELNLTDDARIDKEFYVNQMDRYYKHVDKYINWKNGKKVLLHTMMDMTGIRKAEQAVEQRLKQQELAAQLSYNFLSVGERGQIVQNALDMLGAFIDCSRVQVTKINPEGTEVSIYKEWINPQAHEQARCEAIEPFDPGNPMYDMLVTENRQYVLINDSEGLLMKSNTIAAAIDAKAILVVPIRLNGRLFSSISFLQEKDSYAWSDSELQLALLVASIFAMFFAHESIAMELSYAKDAAERASVAKSRFLSNMSHEIRTPMNAIIGMVQLSLKDESTPQMHERLEKINYASELLMNLINNVLDMSKIEADKLELIEAPFYLSKQLANLYTILSVRTEEKRQRLVFNVDDKIPDLLYGDSLRLTQVMTNIMYNAVKFSDEDTLILLNISMLARSQEQATLRFEITDQGIGMTEEQMEHVFEPFEQNTSEIVRLAGGTGLGLAIAKQIVERMGGEISVESKPGVGSTFAFELTFRIAAQSELIETAQRGKVDYKGVFAGKTILLVEDIDINREIILAYLEETEARIVEAENGMQALQMFEAQPEQFDLILTDVQMPVMNGYELASAVRERGGTLPIVAMTANAFKDDIDKEMASGMNSHISKPVGMDTLIATLKKHIG